MRSGRFLDTNILIYAAIGKQDEPEKFPVASELVKSGHFGASAQTLAEFYNVVSRQVPTPLSNREIDDWLDVLSHRPFTPVDAPLVSSAVALARRYLINYYDASLVAAAERLGASTFYTENLNHGQFYSSVQAINPFV